ncbi:MAG TPA: hypothetical protein VL947_10940, partial [Cytophagales bacterium]|nr:hypothetical protein [Cytophagales bacterium]
PENVKALLDTIRIHVRDSTTLSDTLVANKEHSYIELYSKDAKDSYKRIRYVVGPQKLYEITAYAGGATLRSAHTTAVFNSFKPVDKKASGAVKNPKAQFYKDLVSKDSSTAAEAFAALDYIKFQEKDFPELQKLFEYEYPLDSIHYYRSTKELIWANIFKQDFTASAAFAEKFYKAQAQKPNNQLSLLNGLTVGRDVSHIHLYKKLVLEGTPKLDSLPLRDIRFFYNPEYTIQMFPEAFSLLDNAVWADFALYLIANAASDSTLAKAQLQPYADKIINLVDRNVLGGQSLSKSNWNYTQEDVLHLVAYLGHSRSVELLRKFMAKEEIYAKYLAAKQLLTLGQQLNPANVQYIAHDISYRTWLYKLLKTHKQVQLFPQKYANQKSMAIAQVFNYISEDQDVDTASITIIKEKTITHEGKKGRVYLLKFKLTESDIWYVALSALHPLDKKAIDVDALQTITYYKELKDQSEAKHMEYLIAKFKGELEEEQEEAHYE